MYPPLRGGYTRHFGRSQINCAGHFRRWKSGPPERAARQGPGQPQRRGCPVLLCRRCRMGERSARGDDFRIFPRPAGGEIYKNVFARSLYIVWNPPIRDRDGFPKGLCPFGGVQRQSLWQDSKGQRPLGRFGRQPNIMGKGWIGRCARRGARTAAGSALSNLRCTDG